MNCLFIIKNEPVINAGGIEAVTGILSREFQNLNIKTFCLWELESPLNSEKVPFIESLKIVNLKYTEITDLLDKWNIDIIVIQSYNPCIDLIKRAVKLSCRNIKIIYALHSMPGWELQYSSWASVRNTCEVNLIKKWLKIALYPIYRLYHRAQNYYSYRRICCLCDKFVVLSTHYIDPFIKLYRIKDQTKITSIPNPCRFINDRSSNSISEKENSVLIVSRLIDHPKNLIAALSIWKEIEKDERFKDWNLTIVGDGPDINKYYEYLKLHNIHRVFLVGQQDPTDYYKRSSIFMMTSIFEGFPLTLVEAQYFGNVPIVFKTFASVSDIIKNGYNGIIIDKNNNNKYIYELKRLMQDIVFRNTLATNATTESINYSPSNIAKSWICLFNSLYNHV